MSEYNWGLDTEEQKAILIERINKLAKDGYALELNYLFAVSLSQPEAIEKFKTAVDGIKNSLEFHKEKLASLS